MESQESEEAAAVGGRAILDVSDRGGPTLDCEDDDADDDDEKEDEEGSEEEDSCKMDLTACFKSMPESLLATTLSFPDE